MFSTNELLFSLVIIWLLIPVAAWAVYPFTVKPIIEKLEKIESHLAFQNAKIRKQQSR